MKSEIRIFESWKYCGLLINKEIFLRGMNRLEETWC